MTWLLAVLLGLVQGVAEFLPISSSGHLALFQILFGLEDTPLLFDVMLHFGTLASICFVYWKDITDMVSELVKGVKALFGEGTKTEIPKARRLVLLIIVATLPLVIFIFLKDKVAGLLAMPAVVGGFLCLTGVVLFLSDRLSARVHKDERNATIGDALFVGVCQGIAVLPGLSRSGMTISGGLFRKFDRAFAVRFSFLMSLPAVLGATVLELVDALKTETGPYDPTLGMYLAGVLVAAVSGYFAINLVKKLVSKGKFGGFSYYCIAVGIIAIIFSFVR